MPNPILPYYQKHRNLVEEYYHACKDPDDIEAIHNMRLSVKRIRVVAKLTEQLSNHAFDAKNTLRDLNKFFKSSGRLRDIQITKQLLENYHMHDLDPIINRFSKREKKQRVKFDRAIMNFRLEILNDIEISLADELKKHSEEEAIIAGRNLVSVYLSEIHELFHMSSKEKRLHNIRTRLKDINYLNNIFDGQLDLEEQLFISVARLKELGELAGSWHDHLNLESILQKYLDKEPEAEHAESLLNFTNNLKEKKQELAQEYRCVLMNEMKVGG